MCGIAAIFNYAAGQPVDRGQMGKMLAHMQRRGPDGSGEWYNQPGTLGLGHRRLSIVDLSEAGAQPMVSADRKCVVTFNGEIYNYPELRADLEKQGCRFRSHCDTEVLLHLYQREGEAMLPKLRGMFAFVIWDEQRRGIFVARDPLGIKPLYYADDGRTFRVASQVKTLLAGGGVDTDPEPAGHVGYFLWGHVPAPFTLYRGIRGLPNGSSLWVDRAGAGSPKTYFSVSRVLAEAEQASGPGHSDPGALRAAMLDSVRHHLMADVPVGIFLSAGIDSATLTGLASEVAENLHTVTLGFEEYRGSSNDETVLAHELSRHYGTKHQTIWVTRKDFESNLHQLLEAMDQPSADGVNSYFISQAAVQAGLKVALSGVGGDELFGGYASFQEIPRAVSILRPFRFAQPLGAGLRAIAAPFLRYMTSPKYAGVLEYGSTFGGAYLLRRGMFMPWELPHWLDGDMVREGWQTLQTMARLEATTAGLHSPFFKVAALETSWYLRNQLLRDTDWASMAHSLEVRTPLVDSALLTATAALQVKEPRPGKRDLALTPKIPLPDAILNRRKTGFTVPVRQWLMHEEQAREKSRDKSAERGLRGWARLIYSAQFSGGSSPATPRARRPVRRALECKKILVFRIGQLGDTVAALPAMWAIRRQFPDAEMTLLCDRHPDRNYVFGPDLLRNSKLFQKFEFYPVRNKSFNTLSRSRDMFHLLLRLRAGEYDTLVYLPPSARSLIQVLRDIRFFRLAGIKYCIGDKGFTAPPIQVPGRTMHLVKHEAEMLLARLDASGIATPKEGMGCMDLGLNAAEEKEVGNWMEKLPEDGGRPWVAFGPGSKMSAKRWALERYAAVGKELIARFNIWPVVFGGAEDRAVGEQLLKQWGRGYNAAGQLSLRGAAQALRGCRLYVGNDTGTMHLAAAAGVRCVAVFSARDWPGRWYPYGEGHQVLRATIECEGCGLVDCVDRKSECLTRITADQVLQTCTAILGEITP